MNLRFPLLLALVGCGTTGPGVTHDSGPLGGTTSTPVLSATAVQADHVDAVWWIQWSTDAPGASWVEYGAGGALDRSTPMTGSETVHDIALVGLKPGTSYEWQAVTELDSGVELRSPVMTLQTLQVPPTLAPPIPTLTGGASAAGTGFVQYSQIQPTGETWLVIVDGDGDPVWWQRGTSGTMIVTSRPTRDGTGILYAEWDLAQQDDVASLFRVDLEGRTRVTTILDKGHHDFYEHPDGTFGYFGFEVDDVAMIASDSLMEVREGATTADVPTRIWSWLDDYPVAPWVVCNHMTEGWPRDDRFDEWTHSNSLMMDPSEEHYFVMSKFHDTLLKIRRSDGELVWQLNGQYGDFTMAGGATAWTSLGNTNLWSHGHMSHIYEAPTGSGYDLCMAIFDNGQHYADEQSRAIEVCIDEAALTAEVTWSHEPNDGVTPLMGDVRKLDQSWLIGWAGLRHVDELDDAGDTMWRIDLPPGVSAGRVNHWETLTP